MKKSVEKAEKPEISTVEKESKHTKSDSGKSENKKSEPQINSVVPENTPKERAKKTAESWRKAALNKAVAG